MNAEDIIGTWELIYWKNKVIDTGEETYPFGEDAKSLQTWTADGFFFVCTSKANRQKRASDDFVSGTPEEKARVVDEFFSYCGRYEFDGTSLVHIGMISITPNWEGVRNQRTITWLSEDEILIQTVPTLCQGKESIVECRFKKVATNNKA